MNKNTKEYKDCLIAVILKEAQRRREDAGYNGEFGDRGASRLEEQVRFYCAGGGNGPIPVEWREYEKLIDPMYEVYQQLKDRFKG